MVALDKPTAATKSHLVDNAPNIQPAPLSDDDLPPAQQQATEWFVRLRSERCTAAERLEFEAWLRADAAHRREYAAVAELWQELDGLRPRDRRSWAPPRWATAAVLLVALGVGGYVVTNAGVHRTAKGESRALTLADGTVAHLNTDTEIAVAISDTARTVTLRRGEALFDVAPDAARPFAVVAGDVTIRDIGTRFAVDRHGDRLRVIVAEGRVEIRRDDATTALPCSLGAGYATTLGDAGSCGTVESIDAARALAWREGRLVFDGTPLREVVEEVNRYQEPPLRLAGDGAGDLRLSGAFRIEHLSQLPTLLPKTLPITVERGDGGEWLLRQAPSP